MRANLKLILQKILSFLFIILVWLSVAGLVYIVYIKFKLLFH